MKSIILAAALTILAASTASAQQFAKDYIAFEGAHPTLPGVTFKYVLVPSLQPAHFGRDRDGLLFALALDQNGRQTEVAKGEYTQRGTPLRLTNYFDTGRIETLQCEDGNVYRILHDTSDKNKSGKIITIRPAQLSGPAKTALDQLIQTNRELDAALKADLAVSRSLRKFNEKFAEKLGL